jgi:hypothetical protein
MRLVAAVAAGAFLASALPVLAAPAGKPLIEIRAVGDCAAHPDGMLLPVPTDAGGCVARHAIVKGEDFIGMGHLRDSGRDFLILTLSEPARRHLYDVLGRQSEKPVALLIDGWVVATPVLWDRIRPASLQISGINPFQIDKLVTRFRTK